MLTYIQPLIIAKCVETAGKPLRATKGKLIHILRLRTSCSCGHKKDYHISGKSRCVFGVCGCKEFKNSAAAS
jgi:hypothetical protein